MADELRMPPSAWNDPVLGQDWRMNMETMRLVGWVAIVAMVAFVAVIGAVGWTHATPARQPLNPPCLYDCGRR